MRAARKNPPRIHMIGEPGQPLCRKHVSVRRKNPFQLTGSTAETTCFQCLVRLDAAARTAGAK